MTHEQKLKDATFVIHVEKEEFIDDFFEEHPQLRKWLLQREYDLIVRDGQVVLATLIDDGTTGFLQLALLHDMLAAFVQEYKEMEKPEHIETLKHELKSFLANLDQREEE